jgi:DNA repair exonuclease SbcCD ATPase subunit
MSKSLDAFLQDLRNEWSVLQGKKDEIIRNPPWGKERIPTRKETNRKIDDLLREASSLAEAEVPDGLFGQQKLLKIKQLNTELASGKKQDLTAQLAKLQAKRNKAQEAKDKWHEVTGKITEAQEKITELENRERELLGGESLDDLADQLATKEREHSEADLRRTILKHAAIYLDNYHPSQCPVCDQALVPGSFKPQASDPAADAAAARCKDLSKRISDIRQFREELSGHQKSLVLSQKRMADLAADAKTITGTSDPTLEDWDRYIQNLDADIQSARNQITNAQAEHDRRDKLTRDIETEERFHYYQGQVAAIEAILEKDINGPRSVLAAYDSFLVQFQ